MFHKNITLLFIVTSLVTLASYTAQAQNQKFAIVADGLVSYWTLDEIKDGKVEDIVGDNDGSLQKKQKVVKGKYGNALEFEGWEIGRSMYCWKHMRADMVVEPFVTISKTIRGTDFGVRVIEETAVTEHGLV